MSTFLRNRPLLGPTDAELFVEPAGWPRLLAALSGGLNALIVGAPGAGKTSVLRMLARVDETRPAAYVDLSLASTAAEALVLVAEALAIPRPTALAASFSSLTRPALATPDTELLRRVENLRAAPPTLLLLDEPPGGDEGHRLFGRLRDELWQLDHQWVVAASPGAAAALQRPPANAFFEVRVTLDALDVARQRELLRRRLPDVPGTTIDGLVGRVELPREVISLAREAVLEDVAPETVAERIGAVNERLEQLSDLEHAVVAFVRAHGSTFSSDPALRDAVNISQARLARVLKDLADGGIFVRRQERHGQGRPRVLYELAPDFQT